MEGWAQQPSFLHHLALPRPHVDQVCSGREDRLCEGLETTHQIASFQQDPSQNGSVLRTPPFLSGFIACGLQGLCAHPYMHTRHAHIHQHAHLCTHTHTCTHTCTSRVSRALRLEHTQSLGGMLGRRQRRLVWEKKPCVS